MEIAVWFIVLGLLFLFISLPHAWLQRAPLTTSLVYLTIGILMGPYGMEILKLNMVRDSELLEHLSEVAVIISLFNAGLKMRLPLSHPFWRMPLALASVSMIVNVGLVAWVAHEFVALDWPAAILLGAVLAPTDPVLASDVQVKHPNDRDQLRFTLTTEAGLNDGTAFPFVMLALGLMGLGEREYSFGNWVFYDLLWAVSGGLFIGMVVGILLGWIEKKFRPLVKKAEILNDFLALALIGLAYGIALLLKTYGFLAVFAAGLAVRQLESKQPFWKVHSSLKKMSEEVLVFNEQLERLLEVAVVIALGAMLDLSHFTRSTLVIGLCLVVVIRPVSVFLVGIPLGEEVKRMGFISWFGIRGIGSLYYLAYAITHGIPEDMAEKLIGIVFSLVAISTVIHGISVTPLMNQKWKWRI